MTGTYFGVRSIASVIFLVLFFGNRFINRPNANLGNGNENGSPMEEDNQQKDSQSPAQIEPSPTLEQSVVVSTSTAASIPTLAGEPVSPGFIFEDDFEKNYKSEWKVIDGNLGTPQGKLSVTTPYGESNFSPNVIILDDMLWSNYRLTVDLAGFHGRGPSFGILLKYVPNGESAELLIWPENFGVKLVTVDQNWDTEVYPGTLKKPTVSEGAKFEVIVEDNYCEVFINGKILITSPIEGPEIALVGLFFRNSDLTTTKGYAARVENFKIEALP